MKNLKLFLTTILILSAAVFLIPFPAKAAANGNYIILTNISTSDAYYNAVTALRNYRNATVVSFNPSNLTGFENTLRPYNPRYVVVVIKPEDMKINFARQFLMMSTKLDSDPFSDFSYGFITGATAQDAFNFVDNIITAESEGNRPLSVSGYSTFDHPSQSSFVSTYYQGDSLFSNMIPDSFSILFLANGDPATKSFFSTNANLLSNKKIIQVFGNGDPHMTWLFAGQDRHYSLPDNWVYDPSLVENPPVHRIGIESNDIRQLSLYPAVLYTGTCHSGSINEALVQGDIVGTFGSTSTVLGGTDYKNRFYDMSNNFSFALAMIHAGVTGYFAPMIANHGTMNSQDLYNSFIYNESLGDIHKRAVNEIIMGFLGNAPNLRMFADGELVSLPPTLASGSYSPALFSPMANSYLSDRATRVYYGDPKYNPLANNYVSGLDKISTNLVALNANSLQIMLTANKEAGYSHYGFVDMFHYGKSRIYKTIEIPNDYNAVNVSVQSSSAQYTRFISALEKFGEKTILHVEFDIPQEFDNNAISFNAVLKIDKTSGPVAPSITVLSPNGGESWEVGKTYTVSFKVSGELGTRTIRLNRYSDDGVLVHSGYLGTSDTNNFVYTVPVGIEQTRGDANRYKIQVCGKYCDIYQDLSDNYFSIVLPIDVIQAAWESVCPQGWTDTRVNDDNDEYHDLGEDGANVSIKQRLCLFSPNGIKADWGQPNQPEKAGLARTKLFDEGSLKYKKGCHLNENNRGNTQELYLFSGSDVKIIESLWSQTCPEGWTDTKLVDCAGGTQNCNDKGASLTCLKEGKNGKRGVRLCLREVSAAIPSPSITVLSPNGGEMWAQGSTHAITWTKTSGTGGSVKIELLKAGVVVKTIVSTANGGTYNWTLGNNLALGVDYQIKISSTKDSSISDASDNNFEITTPSPTPTPITCAELIPGYNDFLANRINLIFVGYGYENISNSPSNEIIHNLSYDMIMNSDWGLFSIEPYKSNKNKFNLWYINQSGSLSNDCTLNGNYYCNDSLLIKGCTINNRYRVHLINSLYGYPTGGNPIVMQSADKVCNSRCRAITLVHEFSHSFANLLDEYVSDPNKVADYILTGRDKNCYAGPTHTKEECLLQAPWKDLIGNGCGKDGVIDCTEENPKYNQEIGCYEGCNYVGLGIFRPTRGSYMVDGLRWPFFGLWNEKLIQDKFNNIVPSPSAPFNLVATNAVISLSQINLNWNDNSNNEIGFEIERSANSAGPFIQVSIMNSNVTSWTDTDLIPSTTYYYRVRAYNSGGDSAYSNTASATIAQSSSSITVTSPNGGEQWAQGSNHAVTWTKTSGTGGSVKIELYKGGVLSSVIRSSADNDGGISWAIPSATAVGNDYKIKITSNSDSTINDSSDSSFAIVSSTQPSVDTIGDQKILVLLVKYLDSGPDPITPADAQTRIFSGPFQQFFNEQSYGKISFSGNVYGWYVLPRNIPASRDYFDDDINSIVKDNNINIGMYSRLVVVVNNGSGNEGNSDLGKVIHTINGVQCSISESFVYTSASIFNAPMAFHGQNLPNWIGFDHMLAHEMGHALGLLHANGWDCGKTSFSAPCISIEYGNPLDVMGASADALHFNAYYKELLGWTAPSSELIITKSGRYTINPLETKSGIKFAKIKLANGMTPFYLEYRAPIGFDSILNQPNQNGLSVNYITTFNTVLPGSYLLDMSPLDHVDNFNGTSCAVDASFTQMSPGVADCWNTGVNMGPSSLNGTNTFSAPQYGLTIGPIIKSDQNSITFDVKLATSTQPSITVTYPNGGEQLLRGTNKDISWTKSGAVGGKVNIELWKGGVFLQTIFSSVDNDGYKSWPIPVTLAAGNDYKIKIIDTSNASVNDMSDNNFSIVDRIIKNTNPQSAGAAGVIQGMIDWFKGLFR